MMRVSIRFCLVLIIVILCSLSSCTVQKNITKKGKPLDESIIVNSLKPGKIYKFWDKKELAYEKVKVTSVDSVEVKGLLFHKGTTKHYRKTSEEILLSTGKITYRKFEPVLTVFVFGFTTLIIIKTVNEAIDSTGF